MPIKTLIMADTIIKNTFPLHANVRNYEKNSWYVSLQFYIHFTDALYCKCTTFRKLYCSAVLCLKAAAHDVYIPSCVGTI